MGTSKFKDKKKHCFSLRDISMVYMTCHMLGHVIVKTVWDKVGSTEFRDDYLELHADQGLVAHQISISMIST